MAYDEGLAERIRDVLGPRDGLVEKKMFGGLAFLLRGNMCCGVTGDELMVRVEPDRTTELLDEPHTRPFDMTGRPMKGWLVVGSAGVGEDAALARWVELGVAFASSLPARA